MALTATEEALIRELLDQQAAILSLANNETTITAKLGSTKATIDDLTAATTVADSDLMIVRQNGVDKKLPVSMVKGGLVDLSSYAPLASPDLTGVPKAPTAAAGTNTKQIATTEFVQGEKPAVATQAEMETGTESAIRRMSPLRVAQAIAAKSSGGAIGGRGQVFTTSGTFTVPTGVTAIKVRGCGGGGGSLSSNGGTTSFGAYCSATGGGGTSTSRTGGAATGGDLNITGGAGLYVVSGTSCTGGSVGGAKGGSTTAASTVLPEAQGLFGVYGCGVGGTNSSGGAGGYFEKYITGLTPGESITVTIGAAGTGAGAGICIVEW